MSHPSRVRGLKQLAAPESAVDRRRTKHHRIGDIVCINHVAPLVGVWIETKCQQMHLIGLWEQWEKPVYGQKSTCRSLILTVPRKRITGA